MKKLVMSLCILGLFCWMGGQAGASTMTYDYTKNVNQWVGSDDGTPSAGDWININFPDASGTYSGGTFEYDNYVASVDAFTIFMNGTKDSTNSSNTIDIFLGFGGTSGPASYVKIASFNPTDSTTGNPFTFTYDVLNGTVSYVQSGTTHNLTLLNGVSLNSFVGYDNFWIGAACEFYETSAGVHVGVTPTQTPEPATMLLLGLGLIGVAGLRRKFKK